MTLKQRIRKFLVDILIIVVDTLLFFILIAVTIATLIALASIIVWANLFVEFSIPAYLIMARVTILASILSAWDNNNNKGGLLT